MKTISTSSINGKVFTSALLIAALSVAVKVLGMFKEMVVASYFGIGDDMDAFVLALTVPAYIINVVSGSLNAAFVPAYLHVKTREGTAAAEGLLQNAVALNIALLAILAVALAALAPVTFPLIASSFSAEKLALSLRLFYWLLPTVVLCGAAINLMALLNAEKKFILSSLVPAFVPVAGVVAAIFFAPHFGVFSLVIGMLLGYLGQLLVLGFCLSRSDIRVPLRWSGVHPATRDMLSQYIPVLSGSSLMCSALLVDQTMAATLGSGSIAALNYGTKLVSVFLGIGAAALGTAILPYFSSLVAEENWESVKRTLTVHLRLVLITTIPITVILILFSEPIVALLFQRGAFDAESVLRVAQIQAIFAIQVPFYSMSILFVRLLSSLRMNEVLFRCNVIAVVLNIGLNYIFMQFLGVYGIALSTVVVYICSALYLGTVLFRRMGTLQTTTPSFTVFEGARRCA